MLTLPGFLLGLNLSTPKDTSAEISTPSLALKPFIGIKWKDKMLLSQLDLQHEYQHRQVGENTYTAHLGTTTLELQYLSNIVSQKDIDVFWGIGAQASLPTVRFMNPDEDTSNLESQLWTDLFSIGSHLGLGARKYWDSFFIGAYIKHNILWNPRFNDDFGTENQYRITSEGNVTFSWFL